MKKHYYFGGAEFTLEKLDDDGNVDDSFTVLTGTTIDDETSEDYGTLLFEGLKRGTYQLTETKAPSGYNKILEPITITITEDELDVEETITNRSKFELPLTGGTGILGTLVYGAILLFIGTRLVKIKLGPKKYKTKGKNQRVLYVKKKTNKKGKHF